MISGNKLRKMAEKKVNGEGGSIRAYEQEFRGLCGITEDEFGRTKFDPDKKAVDASEFNFTEMAEGMLGHNWQDTLGDWNQRRVNGRVSEAEGGTVMPSHFVNISAFSASVAGLLDAQIMEAYSLPQFIGDDFVSISPTRTNGGKKIGAKLDGSLLDQTRMASGEPYPTVGLVEDWINVPQNERRGLTVQVNMETLIYDRTEQVLSAAQRAGTMIRYNRERRIARTVMGLDNTYNRLDIANNTYQSSAGVVPHNFVNQLVRELQDYRDIDAILQLLAQNRCPATNFEIDIDLQNAVLLVAPSNVLNARRIARTTEIAFTSLTSPDLTLSRSANPLDSSFRVASSMIWFNVLAEAIGDRDQAAELFWFGNPARAFGYRELVPFQVVDCPLSSEDVRRDIVVARVAREIGVPYVDEPRYVARVGTEEAVAAAEAAVDGEPAPSPPPAV